MVFETLDFWMDPVARSGPEAMAVDEWLLQTIHRPVLRVYGWDGAWASVGYFGDLEDARSRIPGRQWVRRWTGGGTVDHVADWTYSVVVPVSHPFARVRGAESYRVLHDALAGVLAAEGAEVSLARGGSCCGTTLCFEAAVGFDIIDAVGGKLAGAGQRRTRHGLLHQGSVAGGCGAGSSALRARDLAAALCNNARLAGLSPPHGGIARLVESRYGNSEWTERRARKG